MESIFVLIAYLVKLSSGVIIQKDEQAAFDNLAAAGQDVVEDTE